LLDLLPKVIREGVDYGGLLRHGIQSTEGWKFVKAQPVVLA
jgi:hypothetical protein